MQIMAHSARTFSMPVEAMASRRQRAACSRLNEVFIVAFVSSRTSVTASELRDYAGADGLHMPPFKNVAERPSKRR